MLRGISSSRIEEVLRLDRFHIDLDDELRECHVVLSEGYGLLGPLQRYLTKVQSGSAKPVPVPPLASGVSALASVQVLSPGQMTIYPSCPGGIPVLNRLIPPEPPVR